jgi:Fe-S-cluster-containing dehydrogenase component
MYFGDIDDANSEVSKLIAVRKYKTLAPEAGTKPQIYYLI